MYVIDLSGPWECAIPGQAGVATLPGTLDECGIGAPDTGGNQWHPDAGANAALLPGDGEILTRLTRRRTYEGPATLTRRIETAIPAGKRVFLEAERSRWLALRVNGRPVADAVPQTVATRHCFEVTDLLTGDDELTLVCDNSYPGWPREDIVYASAATDETQTNWNGVLGALRLRVEEERFISDLRVYPHGDRLDVCATLDLNAPWAGTLRLESLALGMPGALPADFGPGRHELWLRDLPLARDVRRWDEGEGWLYALTARAEGLEARTVRFGVRDFRAEDGHLTLNGRRVFLRGEANCAVFPETGHPPMEVRAWREILQTYRAYGVNCLRFHSWCPPEAAFEAADELGLLMQPELSHWNPKSAFETDESFDYYRTELERVLLELANHPSLVMLTLGNELHAGRLGHRRMDALLALARRLDPTRLYANGSNVHYGTLGCDPGSDFYTACAYLDETLRATSAGMTGPLNESYPGAVRNYDGAMARLRADSASPVFSFEVGQYEVLPDFDELEDFHGVTHPANLLRVRRRMEEAGLGQEWKRRVAASGELALLCYRAEVEAAIGTQEFSGISLLGLQDFPGQGTALVGMLNSHLRPKPFDFARPERFSAFFRDQLPLAGLDRFTYEAGETLRAKVSVANYGKAALSGPLRYALSGGAYHVEGVLTTADCPAGRLTEVGEIAIPLEGIAKPLRLDLALRIGEALNRYPIWVYPPVSPSCPEGVYETEALDERALSVLRSGGRVYLSPSSDADALPNSVQAHFSTDFWSVGTFPWQSGTMGQLIDEEHPLFRRFPTEFHTNWQWWPMANRRAVILPRPIRSIVAELDSYATLRPMAQLFECACEGGRLLFSSMGLQDLRQYPEARALLHAIYLYMDSPDFAPDQTITLLELEGLIGSA